MLSEKIEKNVVFRLSIWGIFGYNSAKRKKDVETVKNYGKKGRFSKTHSLSNSMYNKELGGFSTNPRPYYYYY